MDKQNQIGLDSLNYTGSGITEIPWDSQPREQAQAQPAPSRNVDSTDNPFSKEGVAGTKSTVDSSSVEKFVRSVEPAARRVAQQLNVPVEAVIGQWGVETGWGKSVIPGTNNLGNIKSTNGQGVAATDNQTGSRDKYRKYNSVDEFADDFINLVGKRYKGVTNSGDANAYFTNLQRNGYAEAKNYIQVGSQAANMAGKVLGSNGTATAPKAAASTDNSQIPRWKDILAKPEYAKLSPEDQKAAKELYFDHYIAPVAGDDADELRKEFLAKSDIKQPPGMLDKVGGVVADLYNQAKKDMTGGSVMQNPPQKPVPADASFAPARPEVRRAIESQWDSLDAAGRAKLEARQDWVGDIARARAGGFKRQDKALPNSPTLQTIDPRVEARRAELIRKGEDPRFADVAAQAGAQRSAMPGQEIGALDSVAQSPEGNKNGNLVTDSGLLLGIGINSTAQNVRELTGRLPGGEKIVSALDQIDLWASGESSEQLLKSNISGARKDLTPEMIAAGEEKWWDSNRRTFGSAWSNPRSYVSGLVQSLPEQVVTMFPAMRLAKGVYAAKIAAGMTEKEAAAAAARAATIMGGLSEGAMAGAGSSREVRDKILSMNPAQLANSEALSTLMAQGMTFEQAREQVANDSATQAFILSGVITAAFGGQGDRVLAKMITEGMGKNVLGRMVKGGVSESVLEELPQEYGSAVAENFAMQNANPNIGLTDDALNRGLGGAATGALQGAGMAGLFGRNEGSGQPAPVTPAPTQANVTPDGRIDPTAPGTPTTVTPTTEPQANAVNPIVADADNIVSELAQQAGIPRETVLPTQQDQEQDITDADLSDFVQVRLEQLRIKRDGGTRMVMTEDGPQEVDMPPTKLTPLETKELWMLEAGDKQQINAFYFGQENEDEGLQTQGQRDGSAPSTAPEDAISADEQARLSTILEELAADAASAEGSAEGGQRLDGLQAEEPLNETEAEREVRLEREAIQGETDFQPTDVTDIDVPFDTAPTNGTQTPQAEQTEAQGTEEPAADAGQLTLEQYQEKSPNPYRVPTGILTTDITKLSDQEVTERFGRDELVQMAGLLGSNVSGTKAEILGGIRNVQRNRERLKDMTREQLEAMAGADLQTLAKSLGGGGSHLNKAALVDFIAKWRDGSLKRTRDQVASFNQGREIARSVQAGNQNISDENIRRHADMLWGIVTPDSHPELYKKVLETRAGKLFTPPFDGVLPMIDALREDADRAKDDVAAQKATDLADALQARYDRFKESSKPKTEKEAKERRANPNPSDSQAVNDFIEGKRDTPPTVEEVKGEQSQDLDAMFDEVLAEETAGSQDEPAAPAEPPKTEREAKEQRTAGQAAASAAKNTVEGFNNAIDGLGELFGGKGTLGSGPVFNEETYAKAKPLFQAAAANFQQAGADIREVMRAVVQALLAKFGKQAVENMKPYVVRFMSEYQQGDKAEPVSSASDLYKPEGKMAVAQTLADEFIGGAAFKTIIEARKRISELIGRPIEAATELAKQADEAIEVAVVRAGREIVKAGRAQGRSPQVIYDRLVDLYNRQPNLAVRSSTSVRDQAYSTPVPLAYLASELAGVTYDSKVLEPTAGNGMLLVGASTENSTANELNPKRADMLKAMGFDALTENAATEDLTDPKSQDAVIANPPFGATKDANGETVIHKAPVSQTTSYETREVDHAIAFNALATMKDDGRAVLIVGGSNETTDEGRRGDYRGKSKRSFYFNLYNAYNVVDHFTVDGSLYSKQGASYPVDVIVIEGRGKSSRDLPAANLPQIIGSYDELKEKLNGNSRVESEGVRSPAGAAGSEDTTGQGDRAPVDRGAGRPGDRAGDTSGAGSDATSVPGSRTAGDRQSAGSGAVSDTRQSQSANTPRLRGDRQAAVPGDGRGAQPRSPASDRGNRSGEVGGERVVAGERVGSGLNDRRGEETETENQVSYAPKSNASSVGTLVPRAMRDSIEQSLQKIEDQFGNIDEYVAEKLNFDPETLRANFSAEQVDALALSIKNAEEGRGFIIGDQTGIGKGRVVAAMIRYALVNDKVPIFVTEKPNLYSDMIRDLDDIGMTDELALDSKNPRILITNGGDSIPYTLLRTVNGEVTENNLTLRAPKSGKALDDLMQGMMNAESLGDYKVIFTTYNQLQTVKGKVTTRMNFVKQFGAGNYMIFDESHNAGGAGETQARTKEQRESAKAGESLVTGRAAFVRQMVNAAFGTFFSSATYAKRPDVMDLYSSTNMKLAVDKISQLGEAIKEGGVPMQQVVANMLTNDGQYIRRERTFAGVSYDTTETKVNKETAENMASAMRSILGFSRAKEAVIKAIQKEMDKEGALIKQMGGEKSTIQGANFGAIMHNLIDQMLLSLKVQDSINHAIERLKAGEKVVLTVSNTMGSFLKDYSEEMGLSMGDPVALSFKDLYDRYLEKQRMVNIKDGAGRVTEKRLTDAELGPTLVKQFEAVRKQIAGAGFGSAPISPIDFLHNELRKAGYKTDEITGRTITLNYQSGTPILASRGANIRQRVNAVRSFNNGDVDVLILNQSGSTGLSLHASSKFKDQRKRHMIIVQAEKNIDTHMQMLGRVHRTGQIIAPSYSQMMADIPAEMRPAAVLMKKMASLNANTTASRKSSVTAEGVVDFINDYGGQVAQEYLRDNPDVHDAIGGKDRIALVDDPSDATEEDIRKFTGYIPILPLKQQEQIYKDLIDRYNELIERENTLGTNKLEAKAVDLDAETISTQQITEDKGDPSIFASPASMEQVDVKRNVKPYTSEEVKQMVNERLGDKTGGAIANEMTRDISNRVSEFEKARVAELQAKETDPVKIESQRAQINMTFGHVRTILQNYEIGASISIKDKNGFTIYGVITDIENKGRTQNPAAGSAWKMQIALANGDAKSLTINFGQIGSRYELAREGRVNWYNAETQSAQMMPIMDIFDKGSTVRREKRWIVTGNILAGFAKYPGQIISYTKKDGTTAQGVLMNRQFDFEKEQKNAPVTLKSGAQVMQFIKAIGDGAMVGTPDGVFRMRFQNGRFAFVVPSSKREGGTYFLDNGITQHTGDFYKRGGQMIANTYDATDAQAALDYIINEREDTIIALGNTDKAREMFGPKPKPQEGVELNDIPVGQQTEMRDLPTNLAMDSALTAVPEAERVSALQRLKSLERKAETGKITEAEYRLGIAQLIAQLQQKADARAEPKDLVRGPDWVKERLIRARRTQELPAKVVDFALWLLDKNPALANDLAISLKAGNDKSTAGSYLSLDRLMTLFKNNVNSGTAVHEILHHAERMMPGEVQKGVIREWQRAWDAAYRKADAKTKEALSNLLKGGLGNQQAFAEAMKAFEDGTLNYDDHYQLTNPSEYWAVNATRIMSQRYGANTWQEKARQFLREMFNYLKGVFGFPSDAPILKGLRAVLDGDGSRLSGKMLVLRLIYPDIKNESTTEAQINLSDIRDGVQARHYKRVFGGPLLTPAWFANGISSQFHKAMKDADFAKAFGYVNAITNGVSMHSLRPAELAPGYLPRITDVRAAAKTLIVGRSAASAQAKASKAIFAGTLAGDTVMEGKVWTEDELRNNFGLDDAAVGLYNQARAAIDASLDEVAAAEAFAMAQGFIPKAMRRAIIEDPQGAESLIKGSLDKQIKTMQRLLKVAQRIGNEEQITKYEDLINAFMVTAKQVEKIFTTSRNLKAAGYAPLMRFGKHTVTAKAIDPKTGNVIKDDEGNSVTLYFGRYETDIEANSVAGSLEIQYAGRDDIAIYTGFENDIRHELYNGISAETILLFAEALGIEKVMSTYIREALSERSALKRKLERKGIEGYTQDMPRVLANFITSNARHASSQYFIRDLNNAIKYIPWQKGDVQKEAQLLRSYVLDGKDNGSVGSALAFGYFLGGSVSSAVVNLTQPVMVTGPYLTQFGIAEATAAMGKAVPIALGKKQITDSALRTALKRASQEGVVDAQEIFHLYSQGAQTAATWLASVMSKVPGAGQKIKAGSEGFRARAEALGVLWGSMYAAAEGFNRRLTFIAAWEVAKATGKKNPYAFAVRAVNETQFMFNKAARPNWARSSVGRFAFIFKQYSIFYMELLYRTATKGGPEGKRAALFMLAVLMLAAGEEGLPLSQNIADLIDTIGQRVFGYDTNTLRNKRELAYKIFGQKGGDLALYGLSTYLPLDFQGRLGLGRIIPGTGILKKSNTPLETARSAAEVLGPTASIVQQFNDALDAWSDNNTAQGWKNLSPKAIKDLLMGLDMLERDYAVDMAGNRKVDTTPLDAYIKMIGFNPTVVAEKNRAQMVERQDINLQRETESSIVKQWARGLAEKNPEMVKKAIERRDEWNKDNPQTKIKIAADQVVERAQNMKRDSNQRLILSAPKEMRERVKNNLSGNTDDE